MDISDIEDMFRKYEYSLNREAIMRPLNLNIIGLRSPGSRVNYFDDTICLVFERHAKWEIHKFKATTYPGLPSLLKPVNKNGTAIMVPGQYSYKLGYHRGKYRALVQAKHVKVYRDNNKNSVYDLDSENIEEGFFGINIHRASFGASVVGPDSSGCQVIKYKNDYDKLISICEKASFYWDNFTYTLVQL